MAKSIAKEIKPVNVEYYPECTLCPKRCEVTANVCMEGEGKSNADFMVIGSAPSEDDDDLNRPMVSSLGQYFRDELMISAEIPESKVRFTYAVRCVGPVNKRTGKVSAPSAQDIRRCRPYLEAEIRRVKPKVILGLGDVPLAALLWRFYKGKNEEGTAKKQDSAVSGIGQWRGKKVWLREFNCWFVPTYNPAKCLEMEMKQSRYTTDLVVDDMRMAWDLSKEDLPDNPMPKNVVVRDTAGVLKVVKEMRENGEFSYDIETGGTGRATEKYIIGAAFSCSEKLGYYIPWDVVTRDVTAKRAVFGLLKDPKIYKVMHNGAYELRIHRMSEITPAPLSDWYYDTMLAVHMVDENFSKRLKDNAWIYTDFGGYDVELERWKYENHVKEDYSQIPPELLEPYGAYDAVSTWIIYQNTKNIMRKDKTSSLFHKVTMPVRRVMCDAEEAGIYVDEDQALKVRQLCERAATLLERKVYVEAGKEFNIGSNQQLSTVLFKDMGFKPFKKTKTGYSVDKDSIDFVATQKGADIAKYLSDLSYVNTMNGTHVSQALAFRWDDGRIHANYNLSGTVTGRASCSNPSLQNVPSDALVRSMYSATPGNYLIEADLKSAELATIAAVSGEETFIRAFSEGLDPHSATFRQVYDLPDDYEPTKVERRMAKAINFGLVYGITAIGLARRLGMTVEDTQDFINLYFSRMKRVHAWMEEQKSFVRENGYVVSVFNRRRRLPYGMSDSWSERSRAERQSMNAPIQSAAADYTYIGLIRLSRALRSEKLDSKIVHTVHDCGLVDAPESEKDLVLDLFHDSFEKRVKALPIKMKIDVEVNTRWGEERFKDDDGSRLKNIFDELGLSA
jgi:uracil-DNA glycosylase family 4